MRLLLFRRTYLHAEFNNFPEVETDVLLSFTSNPTSGGNAGTNSCQKDSLRQSITMSYLQIKVCFNFCMPLFRHPIVMHRLKILKLQTVNLTTLLLNISSTIKLNSNNL